MIHFIVNAHGGNGKAFLTWKKLEKLLKDQNIEYEAHISYKPGRATEIAGELSSLPDSEVRMVVVGGDGTINEVLNGVKDFAKIRFGVIPTGSGNDFSRGLGIPRHSWNLKKALKLITDSSDTQFADLGKVSTEKTDTRWFGISSGIGLDAIVCKKTLSSKLKFFLNCLHLGKFIYLILTVVTLFSMRKYKIRAVFDHNKTIDFNKLIFLAAMNLKAEGGGVPMAPDADSKDGMLSMCAAHDIPKFLTFFVLPLLVMGLHKKMKGFTLINFRHLEIFSQEPLVLHTDGEYVGDVKHITYQCIPAALKLLK